MSTKICEWKQEIIFKLKINKYQEFWIKVKCAGQETKKKSDVGAINNEALGLTGWKVQIRSFFWFVFSNIRTKYGLILHIPPHLVRMRANTDQKKLRNWTHFTQSGWKVCIAWPTVWKCVDRQWNQQIVRLPDD